MGIFRKAANDSAGFTLIELIVVVSIIAIVSGAATFGISTVYNADTERAAKRFIAFAREARVEAKAANENSVISIKLFSEGGNSYVGLYYDGIEKQREMLGNKVITVKAGPKGSTKDSPALTAITGTGAGETVSWSFKKSTGGLNETGYEDIFFDGGETVHVIAVDITGKFYMLSE